MLGPRFGKNVQAVRQIREKDGAALAAQVQEGGVTIEVDGRPGSAHRRGGGGAPDAPEGFAAAQGKQLVVVIATEITEELKQEGLVRGGPRPAGHPQGSNLAYDARIQVTIETADDALTAIAKHQDYIAQEVLASALACGAAGRGREGSGDRGQLGEAMWWRGRALTFCKERAVVVIPCMGPEPGTKVQFFAKPMKFGRSLHSLT